MEKKTVKTAKAQAVEFNACMDITLTRVGFTPFGDDSITLHIPCVELKELPPLQGHTELFETLRESGLDDFDIDVLLARVHDNFVHETRKMVAMKILADHIV